VQSDADFDLIGGAFEAEVYGSSKGTVRLRVLWEDLTTAIPRLTRGGLSILDAGGGAGRLALQMARFGNHVVLAEPSREMLDHAKASARAAGLEAAITFVHAPIQALTDVLTDTFDLITCHAVLEWLAEPRTALSNVAPLLKPDGQLSLLFYNRNAALLKRVLAGELGTALREVHGEWEPRGWGTGCVPLAEEDVRAWLAELGFVVRSKAGIRIFHDHLSPAARDHEGLDALLELELTCRQREPFASLGQHIHLVCDRRR
jgi:S-adenosylmethionine-dependent methyltransferase